jgi:hypothetical protein
MSEYEEPADISQKEKKAFVSTSVPENHKSRALVPFAPALPAAGVINITDEVRHAREEDFRKAQNAKIATEYGHVETCRSVTIALGLFSVIVPFIVPPAMPFMAPTAVAAIWASIFGGSATLLAAMTVADEHNMRNSLVANKIEWTKGLREEFMSAQKAAYRDQKRRLVHAAEQYLDVGNLIGLEEAAWLATLEPEMLRDTTDEIAITVLQIRKMLAHTRCRTWNPDDGSKRVETPLTFASMRLDSSLPRHRSILREKLLASDVALDEDSEMFLKEPELVEDAKHKVSVMRSISGFFCMNTNESVSREFVEGQMPRFKDAEIPILKPVEDFAAALQDYEARNPPLDLPAIRGWHHDRRAALPPPQRTPAFSYPLI